MKIRNKVLTAYSMSYFLLFSCSTKGLTSETLIKQNESFSKLNTKNLEIKNNSLNFNLNSENNSSFAVKFNFTKNKGFFSKANTNGNAGKIKTNINLLRIYLVNSNSSNLNATNIKYGPFDIDNNSSGTLATFFSNAKNGSGNLTFSNVGEGNYYVAIAAYSSSTIINSTTNITSSLTNITSGTNFGNFALSTSGGDSPGLSGVVTVSSIVTSGRARYGLINDGTADLGVTLNLISVRGATIDATTTITEGSLTIPETILK